MVLILAVFLSLGSGLWMQKYEPFEGATTAQTDAKPGAAGILAAKDPGHEVMSKVVYITTRDTTSTTIITIFLCCVSALLMYLLWQYMVQARKLGELERRCKALLEERRHDKGQLKGLRDENQRLSAENAYVQQAYYELDHSSRPPEPHVVTRIPQEVCISAHGRCYHHRSCHTIRNSGYKSFLPCQECRDKYATDVY